MCSNTALSTSLKNIMNFILVQFPLHNNRS